MVVSSSSLARDLEVSFRHDIQFQEINSSLTCLFPTGWCQRNREMVEVSEAPPTAGGPRGLSDASASHNCLFFSSPEGGRCQSFLWLSRWKGVTKTPTFCSLFPSQARPPGSCGQNAKMPDHPLRRWQEGGGEKQQRKMTRRLLTRAPRSQDREAQLGCVFLTTLS